MKHKAAAGLGLCMLALMSGCSKFTYLQTQSVNHPNEVITTQQAIQPYQQLVIQGPMNVLVSRSNKPYIEFIGTRESVSNIVTTNSSGILKLYSMQHLDIKSPPTVTIKLPLLTSLSRITYAGRGDLIIKDLNTPKCDIAILSGQNVNISGPHIGLNNLNVAGAANVAIAEIKSNYLDITANGSGTLDLKGMAAVRHINFAGTGKLNFYWVDSKRLTLKSSGGQIFLGGNVQHLNATVGPNGYLNARYLRVGKGFINTAGNARVDVWVRDYLHAFATNASNIYYYRDPMIISRYMRDSGAVLAIKGVPQCREMVCRLPDES